MKKYTMILFSALLVLFLYWPAMAAMTCTGDSGDVVRYVTGAKKAYVTCTFDTTPGTAVAAIPPDIMYQIDGRFVYSFSVKPGSTGPTNNSDLQIVDCDSVTIVSATANGLDVIDNSTSTGPIYGEAASGGDHYPLVAESCAWTITVTNNAVNNSSFVLIIEAP